MFFRPAYQLVPDLMSGLLSLRETGLTPRMTTRAVKTVVTMMRIQRWW